MAIFKLVGQGVGLAAEYNSHRRQQSQAREAAQGDEPERSTLPVAPVQQHEPDEPPTELPPTYAESTQGSEISLARGEEPSTSGKRTPAPHEGESDFDSDGSTLFDFEDDEGDWELDDLELEEAITPPESAAASAAGLPSYEESIASNDRGHVDQLVHEIAAISTESNGILRSHPPKTHQPLPYPVILPQRRPRKKARGFVRAYAPVLDNCDIDQKTFLSFLKNFHKASQASPIFPVIQVSAAIAGFVPSVVAMAVCTATQVTAQAGAEIQSRLRTNDFLDRINDELFKPHGLFAMIVKYKPDVEIDEEASGTPGLLGSLIKLQHVDLSTNQSIAKYMRQTSGESSGAGTRGLSKNFQNLRLASDTTRGALELPEAAPLIFPNLDYKLQHGGPETFKDRTKDAKKFLADYLDRRAQMQYAMQNPNSSLAVPESQRGFASKLADPTHPMYSGGLVPLLSGGKLNPRHTTLEDRREKRLEKDARRIIRGRDFQSKREGKRARRYGDEYLEELATRVGGRGGFGGRGLGNRGGLLGQLSGAAHRGAPHNHSSSSTAPAPYGEPRGDGDESRGSFDARAGASGLSSSSVGSDQRRGGRRGQRGVGGAVRRIMQEDVLYLIIVNMPTEAELEEARQELNMARS